MDWKLCVSSLIFVCVTILKLIFPDQTEDIRRQAVMLIDMDMNYHHTIAAIGSMLTEEAVQDVMGETEMIIKQHEFIGETVGLDYKDNAAPALQQTLTEQEIPSDILEKVEAFRLMQEAYSEFEFPKNVSYEQLVIPFSYTSPVTAVCSSGFGFRIHPIDGEVLFHYGTDYDVAEGTSVLSFADGVVTALGEEPGYGKYIGVEHEDGWESFYAHCSEIHVASGQYVEKGEVLGKSGSTGRVTGPHLHFELSRNDLYTNPEFFLP